MPLSKLEVETLASAYTSDSHNYWTNKMMVQIAEKNNIQLENLLPSAEERINILVELRDRCEKFLTNWKGEKDSSVATRMLLADSRIDALEDRFTNHFSSGHLSNFRNVSKALSNVGSYRDIFTQSRALESLYNNCTEIQKKYLLFMLANNENNHIFADSISSDLSSELEKFAKSKDVQMIKDAQSVVNFFTSRTHNRSKKEFEEKIMDFGGTTPYLIDMVKDEFGENDELINEIIEVTSMATDMRNTGSTN